MSGAAIFDWRPSKPDAICLLQDGVAATPLVINGSLSRAAPGGGRDASVGTNILRSVSLTSTNDLHLDSFEIKGFAQGVAVNQTINGPLGTGVGNPPVTVETTVFFDVVTSITPNNVANAVSAGTGNAGTTYWFTGSTFGVKSTTVSANVIPTVPATVVSYSLQVTAENDLTDPHLYFVDPTNNHMTNQAASAFEPLIFLTFTYLRFALANTTTGHVRFAVIQTIS